MWPANGPGGPSLPPQERQEPGLLTHSARSSVLATLGSGPIEIVGLLPYSSNRTLLARCGTGDEEILAIYKPAAGERPLWDFPSGTLYRREVAAFEVASALGWDFVPPTVCRDEAPFGPGSVQLFIDHDPDEHYFTLLTSHPREFKQLALFDLLCNNADRKGGHCLRAADGRLWAIDHGLTFHVEPKVRTVIWDFAGSAIPAADRRAVGRLGRALDDSPLAVRLAALTSTEEVAALRHRADRLAQPGRFPAPGSSWAFPWPLV
ncbi:MAG: SCO1664 family protein [Candidatus Dormibacteria bacterium]